ncbi:MAG TPA: hypothetical protein VGO52_14630 [Hyphomonadaceae bacterium]|jgi:hypothetical protein|nr:hypothetical protein [Hyphomonadaceae bacterium]
MALDLYPIGMGMVAFAVMGIAIARYAYMYTRAKLGAPDAPAGAAGEDEINRLKARVAVLEELATDGDRKLGRDIERLGRQGAATGA